MKYHKILQHSFYNRSTHEIIRNLEDIAYNESQRCRYLLSEKDELKKKIENLKEQMKSSQEYASRLSDGIFNRVFIEPIPYYPNYKENPSITDMPTCNSNQTYLSPRELHVSIAIAPEEVKYNPMIAHWIAQDIYHKVEHHIKRLITETP